MSVERSFEDTDTGIRAMPAREDDDRAWMDWANAYPSVAAVGLRCTAISEASATFSLIEPPFPVNPNGSVNGGVLALAFDQIMGVAAGRAAPTGSMPATVSLNVSFHRPSRGPLRFESELIPGGRTVVVVHVVALDESRRRCASATGTMAFGIGRRPDRLEST